MSAAERRVSPANMPRPPEYVGSDGERAISMEKYATVREARSGVDGVRMGGKVMRWLILFSSEPMLREERDMDTVLELSIG